MNGKQLSRENGEMSRQEFGPDYYASLETHELEAIKVFVTEILNKRNSVKPWYGIWIERRGMWVNKSMNLVKDPEKARKVRDRDRAVGWMRCRWFVDKGYPPAEIRELPI